MLQLCSGYATLGPPAFTNPNTFSSASEDVTMAHETFCPMDVDVNEEDWDIVMTHETFGPMDIDEEDWDIVMAHETFGPMDWMW